MSFDFSAFKNRQAETNQEALAVSGIQESVAALTEANKPPKSLTSTGKRKGRPPGSTKAKRPAEESPAGELATRRRSGRTASKVSGAEDAEEQKRILAAAAEAQEAEEAAERAEAKILKHGDRPIEARGGVTGAGTAETLAETLKELAAFKIEDDVKPERGSKAKIDTKKLKENVEDLELRAIVKTIPDRIYSMVVHPDLQKDLVFSGDKNGHISLWDATHAGEALPKPTNGSIRDAAAGVKKEDDEEDEVEYQWGNWWVWQGHQQSSVSSLKLRPGQPQSIYSSSYDGTVRQHHFEQGMSEEVLDGDRWSDEGLIHSFDFDSTGNEIWASDNNGGLIFRDLRTPKDEAKRWNIDGYKVGCVSINPANPRLAATAHLKRTMRLWDLTALRGLDEDSPVATVLETALLQEYAHEKAVSSAYFDWTGTRLASTSYDDAIRVWDVDSQKVSGYPEGLDWTPKQIIPHNNQVGRYVTVLRAHWSSSPHYPPHLFIGNMARTLDLYSPDGVAVKHFTHESITAVPSVTAAHPILGGKYYGGSASGKISYWTGRLPEEMEDEVKEEEVKGEVKEE